MSPPCDRLWNRYPLAKIRIQTTLQLFAQRNKILATKWQLLLRRSDGWNSRLRHRVDIALRARPNVRLNHSSAEPSVPADRLVHNKFAPTGVPAELTEVSARVSFFKQMRPRGEVIHHVE